MTIELETLRLRVEAVGQQAAQQALNTTKKAVAGVGQAAQQTAAQASAAASRFAAAWNVQKIASTVGAATRAASASVRAPFASVQTALQQGAASPAFTTPAAAVKAATTFSQAAPGASATTTTSATTATRTARQATAAPSSPPTVPTGATGGGGAPPAPPPPKVPSVSPTPTPPTSGATLLQGIGAAAGIYSAITMGLRTIENVVHYFFNELKSAIEHYTAFAKQILTIKELTGGTTKQAAGLGIAFQAAGISDTAALRDITHLEQTRHGRGAAAMQQLHVNPMNTNGIETLNKTLDALSKMRDGVRKSQIEMDIFGPKAAASLQPLLNMTKAQREQVAYLARTFDGSALLAVQKFTTGLNLLGMTIEQRLVFPFVSKLLPVLTAVIDKVTQFVDWLSKINDATDGIAGLVVGLGLIGGLIATAIVSFAALTTAILTTAAAQAVLDALMGNWAALAAGAAVGAAVGIGIYAYNKAQPHDADKQTADNTSRMADTLDKIEGKLIGGGPRGRSAASRLQAEYAVAHLFEKGMG